MDELLTIIPFIVVVLANMAAAIVAMAPRHYLVKRSENELFFAGRSNALIVWGAVTLAAFFCMIIMTALHKTNRVLGFAAIFFTVISVIINFRRLWYMRNRRIVRTADGIIINKQTILRKDISRVYADVYMSYRRSVWGRTRYIYGVGLYYYKDLWEQKMPFTIMLEYTYAADAAKGLAEFIQCPFADMAIDELE